MAWIKTSSNGVILAKTGGPGTDDKGAKTLLLRDDLLFFDVGWVGTNAGSNALNDDKWHHVAISVKIEEGEADDTVVFYVDGQESDNLPMNVDEFSEEQFESNKVLVLIGQDGRAEEGEFPAFNGIIDEVRIYNRALSAAEVKQNFDADGGTPPN
jgi:hypothetical protein